MLFHRSVSAPLVLQPRRQDLHEPPLPAVLPYLTIPQPPALELSPRSDRAVVTVATGRGCELLSISRPYMEAYARRLDADFVVLDWPGHPDWPMSSKFAIPRALDHYRRIVYADADVLFRPGCVNLFELCDETELGVVDELQHHNQHLEFGRERGYQRFRVDMGFRPVPCLPWMINAGVMVVPASHKELLLPPPGPMPIGHCAEQDHTNARLLDSGLPYRLLDRRANWMWWTDHDFKAAPRDAVLHWAGMTGRNRAESMRKWAARHPLPQEEPGPPFDPGIPACPEWAIDPRHSRWLYAVLATGRFRRVLEIGCHLGYSTRAFLSAAQARQVEEVHLCDVAVTPELRSLVNDFGLGERVVIHECPSHELLAGDSQFDFALVDGDHSAGAPTTEARLLLGGNRCRAIMAHDTAASGRYPCCEGPLLLKGLLQAAGFYCLEDAEPRPGERTDRGMLLAVRDRDLQKLTLQTYRAIS